jgi:ribose 5-phosphate isomerase A
MNDKELVARNAADRVRDGMLVGLGTGSTANYFIEELARRRKEVGLRVTAAASSVVSTLKAQQLGLPVISIEHLARLDIYVDGADEVTPDMTLLKGRGYDLVREKLMARGADEFIVMVDRSKLVDRIGERYPIPVEVIPVAWQMVRRSLESLGGRGDLRQNVAKDGLAITSHGSLVLDMTFDAGMDSATLNELLNATPGIVEHGIFHGLAGTVLVAADGQVEERRATAGQCA